MKGALVLFRRVKSTIAEFKADESGAALIEYTVLLGILMIAVIGIIVSVGHWISGQWSALNAAL